MKTQKIFFPRSLFAMLLAGIFVTSCCQENVPALESLNTDTLTWAAYTHPAVPYSLRYPEVFTVEEEKAGSVFFRYGCGVPVVVRFHDEKEGRRRGAWFGHDPVQDIQLHGHAGKKYIYDHNDGPFSARTVAYVVPFRDKFLGLEFRTPGELNAVQERILESFTMPTE